MSYSILLLLRGLIFALMKFRDFANFWAFRENLFFSRKFIHAKIKNTEKYRGFKCQPIFLSRRPVFKNLCCSCFFQIPCLQSWTLISRLFRNVAEKCYSANVPKVLIFGLLIRTGTINDFSC